MGQLYKNTRTGDVVDLDLLRANKNEAGADNVLDHVDDGVWQPVSNADEHVDSSEPEGILSQPHMAVSKPFEATVEVKPASKRRQGIAKATAPATPPIETPGAEHEVDELAAAAAHRADLEAKAAAGDVTAQGELDALDAPIIAPPQQ